MSTERPPWAPADIADADLPHYLDTLAALRDRARWAAREYDAPHLLAQMDQLDVKNAHHRDRALARRLT